MTNPSQDSLNEVFQISLVFPQEKLSIFLKTVDRRPYKAIAVYLKSFARAVLLIII